MHLSSFLFLLVFFPFLVFYSFFNDRNRKLRHLSIAILRAHGGHCLPEIENVTAGDGELSPFP